MDCDYTGPGGTPLERIAQQQGGTHPAPCARSCEANAYEIEVRRLNAELERERMRLAACGVVAMADTPESAAQAREMRDEYRSASCDDVARRVDECMTLRAERDALGALVSDLDESSSYWSEYEVPLGIVERIKEAAKTWKGGRQ